MMKKNEIDIVILDDDPDVTELLVDALGGHWHVRTANTLRDAYCAVCRRPPDFLLCDYNIDSLTSRSFLLAVADVFPETRRVLMSGASLKELLPLLNQGVVHAIVTKPIELDRLLASLRVSMVEERLEAAA
jgi:DNA-binding NtrC family response regulator